MSMCTFIWFVDKKTTSYNIFCLPHRRVTTLESIELAVAFGNVVVVVIVVLFITSVKFVLGIMVVFKATVLLFLVAAAAVVSLGTNQGVSVKLKSGGGSGVAGR